MLGKSLHAYKKYYDGFNQVQNWETMHEYFGLIQTNIQRWSSARQDYLVTRSGCVHNTTWAGCTLHCVRTTYLRVTIMQLRTGHTGLLSQNGNFKFRITCYLRDVISSSVRVVLAIKIGLCLSSGRKYEPRHLCVKSSPGLGNFLFSDWSKLPGQSLSVAGCDIAFGCI